MAEQQNYSYLDLAVHDALAPCVLSPDAVVLFSGDLRSILWANASGASLFGGRGVVELLDANLSDEQSFVKQLRNCVGQIEDDEPVIRGFRINQGLRSALLQFEVSPITFIDGNTCYKVTQYASGAMSEVRENVLAANTVESLVGFADAAAIVDDYGLPIAASDAFGRLGPSDLELSALTEELMHETDRLIKRPIASISGRQVVAGLGRIADNPGRNLIVLADAAEDGEDLRNETGLSLLTPQPEEVQTERTEQISQLVFDQTPGDLLLINADEEGGEAAPQETVSEQDSQQDDESTSSFFPVSAKRDEDDNLTSQETPLPETNGDSDKLETLDGSNVHSFFPQKPSDENPEIGPTVDQDESDTDQTNSGEPISVPEDTQERAEPFSFIASDEDKRFAWSIDETGTFTHVSDELAQAVGPNAADIVGRKWDDVATIFGFDTNREISNLLKKRDTWSGKTVLWPVEGTDMVVPIDLAALPAFGPERRFDGFKGFGVVRMLDTLVDPEETGMALGGLRDFADTTSQAPDASVTPAEENDTEPPGTSASHTTLWFEEENPSEETDGEPPIRLSSDDAVDGVDEPAEQENREEDADTAATDQTNVVRFMPSTTGSNGLNPRENQAFETIGNRLREEVGGPAGRIQDTSLLDELPLAILIYRGSETLFANKSLLEASGYENLKELQDAGGVETLLRPPLEDQLEDRDYRLVRANGEVLAVNPVLNTVPWDRDKALQLSFAMPAHTPLPVPDAIQISQASEIQSILDTTSDGIILLKDDGEIISVNASAEALVNREFDEVVGKPFTALLAEESHEAANQYLSSLAEPGVTSLLQEGREVIMAEANGGLIPVFLTIARLESSEKLCAVVQDLTSWKKTEQELVKSRRDAERASEQKSDFLAQVSHEIRTPLNAIIGFSDIMIEERFGAIENKRYREYLRDINRSGKHVLELVNDLLDLSKIEAGKLELTFDAVNLNEIVAESVAMLQPHANTNRIIVRTSLSRSVPKVVADVRSIRQVVLNLVTNAIKFSEPNSQVIVSTVYESSGEVALRVRDTGDGMSAEEIASALKPYRQLHRISEEKREGTGLGLPLTKALVEANRAIFDLESTPGEGTVAHVQFPVQRVLTD